MGLILNRNFCFEVNGRFESTWCVALYFSCVSVADSRFYFSTRDGIGNLEPLWFVSRDYKENHLFSVATYAEETSHRLRQYHLLLLRPSLHPRPQSRPSRSITAGSAETAFATHAPKPTCRCPNAGGTVQCAFATSAWKQPSMMQQHPSRHLRSCICSTMIGWG